MKRIICVAFTLAAALAIPVVASAQPIHAATSKKADLHVTEPLIVGTQTLQPGEYRYQCHTINGETFLVVTDEDGKEVARVPCTPQPLAAKAEMSDIRTTTRGGRVYLTAVSIKGEIVMHRIALGPDA